MEIMLYKFWDALFPILLTLFLSMASYAAKMGISFLTVKVGKEKEEWLERAGLKAWGIVEEYFRMFPEEKESTYDKINMFAKEIRKFVPFITDDQINSIRQAIAGEFNKTKDEAALQRINNVINNTATE